MLRLLWWVALVLKAMGIDRGRSRKRQRSGYVYLLKGPRGLWKIGKTAYPQARLHDFEVKLPFPVEFTHVVAARDSRRAEAAAHRLFGRYRVRSPDGRLTEWFRLPEHEVRRFRRFRNGTEIEQEADRGA